MPLEGFICPDRAKIKLEDCFKECRMGERCQEEPDLHLIAQEREWKGVASTTQLLNGTMLEFLKLTKPYYVDPDSRAFMLAGTKHHKALEDIAKELNLPVEIAMSGDRDIFDLLVFEGKTICIVDRKMWGSFKVAKALGIVETGKQPDPSGECYKTNSKWGRAGSAKMIPVFGQDPAKADNWEAELQLNRYRVMLKEKVGLIAEKLYLRVLVRDGGLYTSKDRGVLRNTYKIPVKILPDQYVTEYFEYKADCLESALEKGWDMPCNNQECWDGMRCNHFCDLWEHCPKGILVHQIGVNK